jgi:ABC-type transporter Mla subunit MlaD
MSTTLSAATADARPSATIIPFPVRKAPPVPAVIPGQIDPQTRLVTALANLNKALAEQKEAVANFRETLGTLAGTVQGIKGSLTTFQDSLSRVQSGVSSIKDEANKTIDILKDY